MNRVYKSKRLIIVLALPVLFIGTLSCASLTGRTAGEIVEDPIITASVKAKLIADPVVETAPINVETYKGVVYLIGDVNTFEQKQRAEYLARQVTGVVGVRNELRVVGR